MDKNRRDCGDSSLNLKQICLSSEKPSDRQSTEIERAIEHIADNVRFLQTHDYVDNSLQAHELALTALKEKLEREKNPLTCDGCKFLPAKFGFTGDKYYLCEECSRGTILPDRFIPKGEKA